MTTPTPRADVLREALERLLADLDGLLPYVRSADVMNAIHGGTYDGPEGGIPAAMERARTALATPAHPEPLDVERLARAIDDVDGMGGGYYTSMDLALALAARLSETPR